jgi:hypothetical protein
MKPKEEKFNLPGAERFTQYMREKVKGILSVTGPEIVDNSYNGEYGKEWIVYLEGKKIGSYYTFGPKPSEKEFGRQYSGRIPGYVNDAEVVGNKYREDKIPIDTVELIFGNEKYVAHFMHEGAESLIPTPWQRQDGHSGIVFP